MRILRGLLVVVLSYAIGVQPAVAQFTAVRITAPAAPGVGASAAAVTGVGSIGASAIQPLTTLSAASLPVARAFVAPSAVVAPALAPSAAASAFAPVSAPALKAAPVVAAAASVRAALPLSAPTAAPALAAAPLAAASTPERVAQIRGAADRAADKLSEVSGVEAAGKAEAQFAALTGEFSRAAPSIGDERPGSRILSAAPHPASYLDKPTATDDQTPKAEPPAPQKPGFFTVFHEPERNKAFWRYVSGYAIFLFGFEMYVVTLPYLISSLTMNALKEKHDPRAGNDEAVKELIRSNRSLSRIAHWAAQGISYITIPLFTRNQDKDGPRKWLVKSMLIRAGVLAAVPVLFFSTGILGLTASMWVLFGLIAAQAFFQGISVTAEGAGTTRMLGEKSVTPDERTKANSILTVLAAVIAIIGPLIAGEIGLIGPVMGKTGVGGAVIYGIYAATIAITGLIYATIKIFGGPSEATKLALAKGETPEAPAPKTFKGVMAELWTSIKDGTRIVFKDRLLRTMMLMSLVSSLFSDPLIFNVLPEYIEGLAAKNPGTIGMLSHIPGVGWLVHTLTASSMGNFALMMVMASVGSIVATALMKPLTKLFAKFGFKTEEGLSLPFYFLAALEAPLFLLMIHTGAMFPVIALYGLQSLVVGFIGIHIQGLYQKNLGGQKDGSINKILSAESLLGIGAAIISTFAYGFLLKNIAISTSLLIAAIATCVVAAIRIAAPFLMFTKAERHPPAPPAPPVAPSVPPAHAMPSTGDHNGPNSILSTHL
jgi:MFS family permease